MFLVIRATWRRASSIVACAAVLAIPLLYGVAAPGATVAAQTADPVPGEGAAAADVLGLNIKTAGVTIGFTLGRSLARYQESQGSAEARALDLGALPVLFGEAASCDGSTPVLPKETLPPSTATDSSAADAGVSRRVEARFPAGIGAIGPSAGFQDATATPQPSSRAIVDSTYQDLGIFAIEDPHSEATTKFANGTREAHAITWAKKVSIFGGLIVLRDPRWEATARSGAVTTNDGSFTFSGATVLGIDRTFDQASGDVKAFGDALAAMLSNLGVHLDYPTVNVTDGRVVVSPLQFRLTDLPLGVSAIGPFLAELQPLREILFKQLTAQDCKNAQGLQLVDVVLQVLSGSGSVVIPVGGVDVSTAATSFPVAQIPAGGQTGDGGFAPSATDAPSTSSPSDSTFDSASVPSAVLSSGGANFALSDSAVAPVDVESASTVPSTDAPTTTRAPAERALAAPAAVTPAAALAEPASSATAIAVGGIALVGAAALALADQLVMRRSRRRIIP